VTVNRWFTNLTTFYWDFGIDYILGLVDRPCGVLLHRQPNSHPYFTIEKSYTFQNEHLRELLTVKDRNRKTRVHRLRYYSPEVFNFDIGGLGAQQAVAASFSCKTTPNWAVNR